MTSGTTLNQRTDHHSCWWPTEPGPRRCRSTCSEPTLHLKQRTERFSHWPSMLKQAESNELKARARVVVKDLDGKLNDIPFRAA